MPAFRNDHELCGLSFDVYWRLRQVLVLSVFLDTLRQDGHTWMHDVFDVAALEAFTINARALLDFIWGKRTPKTRLDDVLAVDWFDDGDWQPYEQPPHLADLRRKVGKDIAHITLQPGGPKGWRPRAEASALASGLEHFAKRVPPERVAVNFRGAVTESVAEWRMQIEDNGGNAVGFRA